MNGSQPPPLHPTTTPLSSSRLPPEDEADPNDSFTDEIDVDVDVDVESLRRVFGSTSPEDLYRRKPHELRALWMEAMQEQEDQKQQQEKQQDEPTDAYAAKQRGLPRFLLDPKDDQHVAPHTFALQLLLGNRNRFRRSKKRGTDGDGLYRKVATKTDDGDDDGDDDDDNEYGEAGSSRGRMASRRRRRPSQSSRKQQQQQQHQHQQRQRLQQQQCQRQRQPDLPGSIAMLLLATVAAGSLACQFVLEVLGGAGAIWGCAELFGLRTGGLGHPTGDATQTIALGVGLVCCARFFLVRWCCGCCGAGAPESSPSVRDRFRRLVRSHRNGNSNGNGRWALGLELARIAADDPVRFLHPAHGPVSWSWSLCGRSSARDEDDVDYQDDENEYEDDEELGTQRLRSHGSSPPSLGGTQRRNRNRNTSKPLSPANAPSPQRSTWELSSDDDDDDDERWSH